MVASDARRESHATTHEAAAAAAPSQPRPSAVACRNQITKVAVGDRWHRSGMIVSSGALLCHESRECPLLEQRGRAR